MGRGLSSGVVATWLVVLAAPALAQTIQARRGVPLYFDHDEQSLLVTTRYQLCEDVMDDSHCKDLDNVVRHQGTLTFQFPLPTWVANGAHVYAVRAFGEGEYSDPSPTLTLVVTGKPLPPTNYRSTAPPAAPGTPTTTNPAPATLRVPRSGLSTTPPGKPQMVTTLETDHGMFLCAEEGGGTEGEFIGEADGSLRPTGLATGTRELAGAWETFTVERAGDLLYLVSVHGQYGCAEAEGQDGRFVFNRPAGGAWEALRPLEMPDGRVAFEIECRRGYFLCAEPDGRIVIRQPMWEGEPAPDKPGGWESFTASADLFPEGRGGGADGIPLAGPVRILGEIFSDDNGAFLPIGCHFGEAFSAWCRGKQTEVRAQVRAIRAAGYDHIRVWLNLGYYDSAWHGREVAFTRFRNKSGHWVEATPQYYEQFLAFTEMLNDEDMRGLFSRGDCNSIAESEIQHHLHEVRRVLSHHPQVIFGVELANEKWQNFPPAIAEDEVRARSMMETAFGGTGWVLQNSCPPGSGEEASAFAHMVQNWFPCANVHGTREFGDMEKVLRRFFNYGYERYPSPYSGKKYALESTEPGGPGQGVSVGNTSDLWKILAMHAATLIGRTGTVYMSGFGVFWDGPIESQPGFWEVPGLRDLFQPNAFLGQAVHGGRGEAWITSNGGFSNTNPHGYARVDQLIYDRDCVAIAHSGGSGRALRFKVGGSVSIRNFDAGLTERLAFEAEPNYVRDVGGDCLVVMRAGRKRARTYAAVGSRRRA